MDYIIPCVIIDELVYKMVMDLDDSLVQYLAELIIISVDNASHYAPIIVFLKSGGGGHTLGIRHPNHTQSALWNSTENFDTWGGY